MNDTQKKIISQMLDELILKAAPKARTVPKYGGVLYTLKPDDKEGQFCGIFSYKNHVQLAIVNEPPLKDPGQQAQHQVRANDNEQHAPDPRPRCPGGRTGP